MYNLKMYFEVIEMTEYFFPSCKVVGDFKNESDRLAKYMKKRFGLDPIGCCRPNYAVDRKSVV